MQYKITLQSSGHEFISYDNESILEAGLRAGYNLRYQCDNGSCGECKSRLIGGQIKPIHFSDYTIGEAEKAQGKFLLCASQALSDLVIEADEYDQASDMPDQEIVARVKKIDRLQQGIIVLQLRTPRTRTLRFLAGQSARLEVNKDCSKLLQIASCPCNGMLLEFHVRYIEGEPFSEYIFNQISVHDEVLVMGPSGDFTLDETSERPLLFIAYDTGFAGVKSLIEHAIALEIPQDIYLYRIACNPSEDYMHNICRAWDNAIDNFHYQPLSHCVPIDCSDGEKSRLCSQFLSVLGKAGEQLISKSDVYLSGLEEMVINLGDSLQERGLPERHLHMQKV